MCALSSHEAGIQLLRKCLAEARNDPEYLATETQSRTPKWGSNDDFKVLRPFLQPLLRPDSAPLPDEVMVVPAAFFRDAEFQVPDARKECVLVCGGVENVICDGADGGSHFMPYVSRAQVGQWLGRGLNRWSDMWVAVEGRCEDAVLLSWVRDAGDCYFHSLLLALRFKDVTLREDAAAPSGTALPVCAADEITPSPRLNATYASQSPASQSPKPAGPDRRGLSFDDALEEETSKSLMTPDAVGSEQSPRKKPSRTCSSRTVSLRACETSRPSWATWKQHGRTPEHIASSVSRRMWMCVSAQ